MQEDSFKYLLEGATLSELRCRLGCSLIDFIIKIRALENTQEEADDLFYDGQVYPRNMWEKKGAEIEIDTIPPQFIPVSSDLFIVYKLNLPKFFAHAFQFKEKEIKKQANNFEYNLTCNYLFPVWHLGSNVFFALEYSEAVEYYIARKRNKLLPQDILITLNSRDTKGNLGIIALADMLTEANGEMNFAKMEDLIPELEIDNEPPYKKFPYPWPKNDITWEDIEIYITEDTLRVECKINGKLKPVGRPIKIDDIGFLRHPTNGKKGQASAGLQGLYNLALAELGSKEGLTPGKDRTANSRLKDKMKSFFRIDGSFYNYDIKAKCYKLSCPIHIPDEIMRAHLQSRKYSRKNKRS